jgi:hypothetical protein
MVRPPSLSLSPTRGFPRGVYANTLPLSPSHADGHGHGHGMDALTRAEDSAAAAPDMEGANVEKKQKDFKAGNGESDEDDFTDENALAQIIGVAILEFGVVLHRHV